MSTISELREKYKGEWLAIEVTRYQNHEPLEGTLLYHDSQREKLWDKLELKRGKRIYVTYAGPLIEEGYVVAF